MNKSKETNKKRKGRKCSHCQEWYPETHEYYYYRSRESGLFQNECIECTKERIMQREEGKESTKKYRIEHMLDSTSLGRAVADSMRPISEDIL